MSSSCDLTCASCSDEFLLEDFASYKFLSSGHVTVPGMNDQQEFKATLEAMNVMKFTEQEIKAVFRVSSGVLLLGNLDFTMDKSEQATLTNDSGQCHVLFRNLSSYICNFFIMISVEIYKHKTEFIL